MRKLTRRATVRVALFGATLLLCLLLSALPARAAAPRIYALLIGCENFPHLPSLAPSVSNNVYTLTEVLTQMRKNLVSLRTVVDGIGSAEDLAAAIESAYAGAQPEDLCLFYVSTHGQFRPEAPEFPAAITLTNGLVEHRLTAAQLQDLLSGVPATKLVLIDACNSGAMVGKGVIPNLNDQPILPFHRADYKVLTSAGGNELSWNWSSQEQNRSLSQGSSYFAKALASGLGLYGQYGADLNRDGKITLREIYRYLLGNHGSSTTHVYPQDDDCLLFQYDPRAFRPPDPANLLSAIAFSSDVLSADAPQIDFSFTVHRPVRMQYQLVYSQNGGWDWDNAELFLDTYEPAEEGSDVSDGTLSPGRKQRTIQISGIDADTSGYALLQIMTLGDDGPEVFFSKLLAVVPTVGNPRLRVDTFGETFTLGDDDELAVEVAHAFPARLTVVVCDAYGRLVYRLATDQASRPLHLSPEGTLFYWNGRDLGGRRVPPGLYIVRASTQVGGTRYEAEAPFFMN